ARSAETALSNSERAYARAARLVQAGILPQKDSDQAAADLAQAQVAAITARRAQELAALRAPLAGVVTRMTAVLGAAVDQSQPLVEVADPAALDIVLDVSPAEAAAIRPGDEVNVATGEGGGEALGQGVVTDVAAAVDSVSRAVAVRARLVRPARPLRIGETVSGKIVTQVHARAVTVPVAALVPAVTRVRSRSIRGGTEISVDFSPTTEMVNALQEVRARIDQIVPDLPAGVNIQIERMAPSLFPILSYNVEGGDPATLYDIARYQIKPIVSRVPGVGRVDVLGSDVREIEVVADPSRLTALGMTYAELADQIRDATAVTAVGRLPSSYKQYLMVSATE